MRRVLTTVVVSAALLTGFGVTSAAASTTSVELAQAGWCNTAKKIGVATDGRSVVLPAYSATGSTNCTLAKGANGSAVVALQRALRACDVAPGLVVDGDFGDKTKAVLQQVQKQHKLDADGIYGPKTRRVLMWPVYYSNGKFTGGCRPF